MTTRIGTLAFAVALLFATSAGAQIASPPPTLQGQTATHLFSVPGVVNNGLATVFVCTNVSSANIIVGVEVFGAAGGAALNDPSATSLTVAPSGTAMFGTQSLNGLSVDTTLGVGLVSKGSARILASARSGIICTAFLAEHFGNPIQAMTNLTIIKKTTQQGD